MASTNEIRQRLRRAPKNTAVCDHAAISDAITVAAPGAGKAHFIVGYYLVPSAAVRIEFESAATDKHVINAPGAMALAEEARDDGDYLFACAANEALTVALDGTVRTTGRVAYKTISV